MAYEDGLDLAVSTTELGTLLLAPRNGSFLFQETDFKPGFKVGLGVDLRHDDWSAFVEYAWFRSTTSMSSSAPGDARGGVGVWLFSNWFNRQNNVAATALSSEWTLDMDIIDAALSRPYYQGTHLIFAPIGGFRAQLIRQKLNIDAEIFTSSEATPPLNATSISQSDSWAVGPRVGFLGEWHLDCGFRFVGDMAGCLLYTRYTKASNSQSPTTTAMNAGEVSAHFTDYDTVRAASDFTVGLGWGRYVNCRKYHFDLLATYDFQIFWDENMMRQIADTLADGTGHAPSNLYLQGLTVRTQLDF